MMAIPKKLLIHEVTHKKKVKKDRWGNGDEGPGQIIQNVRIEPSSKIVRDKNNAEVKLSAVMFYDCKNSKPRGVTFAEDDIIIFQGMRHRVQVVEPLYDERKLHHYELGLIKYA